MSEFNKYIPRTTADHIVMRGTAFYKCSDIDPKLDEIAKLKELLATVEKDIHDYQVIMKGSVGYDSTILAATLRTIREAAK